MIRTDLVLGSTILDFEDLVIFRKIILACPFPEILHELLAKILVKFCGRLQMNPIMQLVDMMVRLLVLYLA